MFVAASVAVVFVAVDAAASSENYVVVAAAPPLDLYNEVLGGPHDILNPWDRSLRNSSGTKRVLYAYVDNLGHGGKNHAHTKDTLCALYLDQYVKMYTLCWCMH